LQGVCSGNRNDEFIKMTISIVFIAFLEYPPEIINAGKGKSAETLKQKMEESALVIKTTYW
jgi:hypothetical protein